MLNYGRSHQPADREALECQGVLGAANVDGALIGGASLKADEFLAIAGVYR